MLCQKRQMSRTVQIMQEETTLSKHCESYQAEPSKAQEALSSGCLCPSCTLCVCRHSLRYR